MFTRRVDFAALALSLLLIGYGSADAGRKSKKAKHKSTHYHGVHPLSIHVEDGFCYIEVPHVHGESFSEKHRTLYRDHNGSHSFIADPVAYGYDGPRHSYYGHHPIAVEVLLGEHSAYESGQHLEFCYLDGPHYHHFAPPAGLRFELKADASFYIGELPSVYVHEEPKYSRVNRVYASIEVDRPVVVFDSPPVGYVGPILDVHVTAPAVVVSPGHADVHIRGPKRPRPTGRVHAEVEIHIPTPRIEIGIGLPGVVIGGHHHHGKHRKSRKRSKSRKHRKSRKGRRW